MTSHTYLVLISDGSLALAEHAPWQQPRPGRTPLGKTRSRLAAARSAQPALTRKLAIATTTAGVAGSLLLVGLPAAGGAAATEHAAQPDRTTAAPTAPIHAALTDYQ